MAIAKGMLDECHDSRTESFDDVYSYPRLLGRIGSHNVVVASPAFHQTVTTSSVIVANSMLSKYTEIRLILSIGIGGGAPSRDHDIRLGDVVVSKGVIRYEIGKRVINSLTWPPKILQKAVSQIQEMNLINGKALTEHTSMLASIYPWLKSYISFPSQENDQLFEPHYDHPGVLSCHNCDIRRAVSRSERLANDPQVHYGLIASTTQALKQGLTREILRNELGVLCFESEATQSVENFPCLMIRGISNYADTHKNEMWLPYAATTAAAYAKELLLMISSNKLEEEQALTAHRIKQPEGGNKATSRTMGRIELFPYELDDIHGNLVDIPSILRQDPSKTEAEVHKISHPTQVGTSSSHGSDTAMQLQQQADVNIQELGRKYSHWATQSGHEMVMKQLLENSVHVNKKNDAELFYASGCDQETIVKRLLDNGANVNIKDEKGNTPLLHASQDGYKEVVKQLLDDGAHINIQNKIGDTLLLYASQYGYTTVVKQLLDSGANINIKNEIGDTPLLYASRGGHKEVVKQLLDSGADINMRNGIGDNPLSYASYYGHKEVMKQLLDSGADINMPDRFGDTPLLYASQYGYTAMVQQLLDSGANINIKNKIGDTPLSYASRRGHVEVVKQLLDRATDAKVLRQSHHVQGTLKADLERAIFSSEIGDAIEDAELQIGKEKMAQHANDHPNTGYVTTMERPAYFGLSTNTGYASMGKCQSDNQECEEDDICTIMSENEELYMPQEPKETLVTALADALYHDIGPLSRLSHAVPTIFRSLPALLKEFTIRLRHTASGKMHTEAISFVRQNRQWVFISQILFKVEYLST